MSNQIVDWRIMRFETKGNKLLEVFQMGKAEISDIKNVVCPNDDQEMCGSYGLSHEMISWLAVKFKNYEIVGIDGDLFIERDS
jgi:hypothetical protein